MSIDPDFLQKILELRSSAVGYSLGKALTEYAGGRAVLEVHDAGPDVGAFAKEGHCEIQAFAGLHSQHGVIWVRKGTLEPIEGSSWTQVSWEGHAIEIVRALWDLPYRGELRHWIIADDDQIARRFATALSDFSAYPRNAVPVFSNGCWRDHAGVFKAIQNAQKDDLILPDGFLARVLGDAQHFVGGRETYEKYGVPYKRGLLLVGPPGNGKTACLRVLLKEVGLPAFVVRSFRSRHGEEEENIAKAFVHAKRFAPCALVLEDLDVLVSGSALSALLNELDGLGANTGILTVATSNRPEQLDPALSSRPSRFDRIYRFDLPDEVGRRRFFARWNQRIDLGVRVSDEVIEALVTQTKDFSFAYLQELAASATVRWVAESGQRDMGELLRAELEVLASQRQSASMVSVQREETADY